MPPGMLPGLRCFFLYTDTKVCGEITKAVALITLSPLKLPQIKEILTILCYFIQGGSEGTSSCKS